MTVSVSPPRAGPLEPGLYFLVLGQQGARGPFCIMWCKGLITGLWGSEEEVQDRPSLPGGLCIMLCGFEFTPGGQGSSQEKSCSLGSDITRSLHPYALLSSGAFRLHHFADQADLPVLSENSHQQTPQSAATPPTPPHLPSASFVLSPTHPVVPPKINAYTNI